MCKHCYIIGFYQDSSKIVHILRTLFTQEYTYFHLALNIKIWGKPHYRNGTYQEDLLKNLRNVAIPGTGIALSKFCHNRVTAIFFILVINPIICLFSAIIQYRTYKQIVNGYLEQLLTPDDWFSYWRINCILASYHSMHTHAPGYAMEDKWAFLIKAKENGIAVSPWLEVPNIVVKNVNEEGGLGIHFFKKCNSWRTIYYTRGVGKWSIYCEFITK